MKWISGIFAAALAAALVLSLALPAIAQGPRRPPPPPEDLRARPGHGAGWSVDPESGCWIWTRDPRPKMTVTWNGHCGPDGRATGRGIARWLFPDGTSETFEGECREGKPDGRGVSKWSNGDRYEGEYRHGNETGKGVYRWSNGDRYEGEFRDRIPNGYGVFTHGRDARKLVGTWVDGCLRDQNGTILAALNRPVSACR